MGLQPHARAAACKFSRKNRGKWLPPIPKCFAQRGRVTYGWKGKHQAGRSVRAFAASAELAAPDFCKATSTMPDFPETTSVITPPIGGYQSALAPTAAGERHAPEISVLLKSLDEAAAESGQSLAKKRETVYESKLVQARLGMASGLHAALRAKHPPTASHSLRVALGCSSWAATMELGEETRDLLEVAALLHDVGKIGVPDKVLLKPGRLAQEEIAAMSRHAALTTEVLASCGAPQELIEIVHYSRAWYSSNGRRQEREGEDLPMASRMLSIVDAFDSMTTDQLYRPARSRERALAELFQCAGSQFDPVLVRQFQELFAQDQNLLTDKLARRWLHRLPKEGHAVPWNVVEYERRETPSDPAPSLFEKKLIDNMHDGVVFVDSQSTILLWNTGVERLTGVSGAAACGRTLLPNLMDMCNGREQRIANEDCPIAHAIATGVQWLGRVSVMGRQGAHVAVDLHAIPVRSNDGAIHGATVLLHDVSSETSLEEKCQALHAQVAKDPMTQVANRAEFDRMLNNFVAAHQESNLPCSLIMSDLDHFKQINDTHGHQAGDTAIITFASLLKSMCRSGDLVARYGGEEFAILCADCTNAAGARKAEAIRQALAAIKHSKLGNASFTASFGVTELQVGDTPETMLRRADRALLQAKDQGRNQVVQLGDGMGQEKVKRKWWQFQTLRSGGAIVEATLISAVPIEVAIQKLRGFIADQKAKIVKTNENELQLAITDTQTHANRRSSDRAITFLIELKLSQQRTERRASQGFAAGTYIETRVEVTIRPRRDRDRRRDATVERARRLLGSLKSYLMAREDDGTSAEQPAAATAK
jgi:diguanylate cyclase (GGDEF)-like protein/PAS domain S-box-containing protein/putative nucleotidyltransferase with HDIG domain